ncbi:Transcriptional regulator, LysR family [Paraburkholderia piptadeniae]|uniref:Transcriptional regulator, LysR family n=1 Tax=Paraburkholderia piptadeniae TaxID=1701573 RepID=A0A1N7RIL8_9BURK|nr:LysR family transcriptional regulator [Paraburkholderia piptadeniae]SIT34961.1 Transcriptional regulator, LysR family [Paraburkholderia piptadeniae]
MDRLTSLTAFCQVVECGSFSAAGRRLDLSANMISRHVQSLEVRLGVRLFNRTTRQVKLTEIGRLYYERSSQILSELDDADRIVETMQTSPRGKLRLHVNTHLVRFLAPILSEYLTLYPSVSLELVTGERAVDLIEDGYDLALRTVTPPDSGLIIRSLTPWRQVICCSPSYLARHGAPRHPSELAGRNCLQYQFFPSGNEWRFEAPSGETLTVSVGGNLTTTSAELLRSLALDGIGILVAPSFLVADDIAGGTLIRLFEEYKLTEFAINAIYPHRRYVSAKVRTLIDLLVERMSDHREWVQQVHGGS